MNLCSDNNHGEIVYEKRECPACARIAEMEDEIDKLQALVQDLEAQL